MCVYMYGSRSVVVSGNNSSDVSESYNIKCIKYIYIYVLVCVCVKFAGMPLVLKWVTKNMKISPICVFLLLLHFCCGMQHTNFRLLNYAATGETFMDAVMGWQAISKWK